MRKEIENRKKENLILQVQHQNTVLDLFFVFVFFVIFFFDSRMCVYIYIMTDFKLYNIAGDCGVVRTVVADAATVDI